jgi:carbamoyltransferase
VQEVTREANPRYYELIKEFHKLSGVGAVLDTSLNDREKPICLTPRDAIQTFYTTGLDVMVLENFLLEKEVSGQKRRQELFTARNADVELAAPV